MTYEHNRKAMITKLFEIRDRNTFIPVLATKIDHEIEAQSWLLRRAGFDNPNALYILLCRIDSGDNECRVNRYEWRDRTMVTCHTHIVENWAKLNDGDVIDIEFILGEAHFKKVSERIGHD